MFWYGHDIGGWGWFALSVGMIVCWALIALVFGALLHRTMARPSETVPPTGTRPSGAAAGQLLAERFARGEIDEDEYHRRLTVLTAGTGDRPRLSRL
ncbi:SHOCT domain-containing protein [Streptomyces sp. NPDC007905]|uniref:SHOCT domain-containing protein n=1 Tax=Streptomyces sp. NPDC007905 TaxID=3364788 RepID=UPI0036E2341B